MTRDRRVWRARSAGILAGLFSAVLCPAAPPVRAITAFVRVERATAEARLADAAAFLKQARAEFERRGLQVSTLRVATTPVADFTATLDDAAALRLVESMDRVAQKEGFRLSVGPFAASREKLAAEAFRRTSAVNGSMRLVDAASARAAANLILALSTQFPDGRQNFRFAATAQLGPGTPFFPGAYASPELDHSFALASESAGVVREGGDLEKELAPLVEAGEAVARAAGWKYVGLDTSPAPAPGNSIAAALEKRSGAPVGAPGTLAAAASITSEIKSLKFRQTGYSGLMLPVLEDDLLARRAAEGRVNLHSLLLYSAVCGTGLDTVPLPGDMPAASVAALLEEVALLAKRWNKPLTARLFLVPGKKPGEEVRWELPFLVRSFRVMDPGR